MGTVVLGFSSEREAGAVRGRQRVCGQEVWAEQAYSARCRSDRFRFVKTWWRQEGEDQHDWDEPDWDEVERWEREQWEREQGMGMSEWDE